MRVLLKATSRVYFLNRLSVILYSNRTANFIIIIIIVVVVVVVVVIILLLLSSSISLLKEGRRDNNVIVMGTDSVIAAEVIFVAPV